MAFSLETVARIYASGRNYVNLGLGFATSVGLFSVAQSKTLTESLTEVYTGISQVAHGLTSIWQVLVVVGAPAVGAVLAWYAQRSAKTENKQASIIATAADPNDPKASEAKVAIVNAAASLPEVQKVVAPALADIPATASAVVKA